MGVTITGKLNKPAHQFQAGESLGFGVSIGVQYYDNKEKQKLWTNYKAVLFSKNQNQIGFLQAALIEGAVIEISGDSQKVDSYDGNNGQVLSIEILNARLGFVYNPQHVVNAQSQQHNAPAHQQQRQAPQQHNQQQAPIASQGYGEFKGTRPPQSTGPEVPNDGWDDFNFN